MVRMHGYGPKHETGLGVKRFRDRNRTGHCHLEPRLKCSRAAYCGVFHKQECCSNFVAGNDRMMHLSGCKGCAKRLQCDFVCRKRPVSQA